MHHLGLFGVVFLDGLLECLYRVVTDLLEILQATTKDVDGACVLCGLDAEVHCVLGGMGHGVAAEGDVGVAGDNGFQDIAQSVTLFLEDECTVLVTGSFVASKLEWKRSGLAREWEG